MATECKKLWSKGRALKAVAPWVVFFITGLSFVSAQPAAGDGETQLTVVSTLAYMAPLNEVIPQYEQNRHVQVKAEMGASMGTASYAIPVRLQRGDLIDVVVLFDAALDDLIKQGKVLPGSKVNLATSGIGMAVKAGAAKPDISTVEALKQTLLAAKSVAYSDGLSGIYVSTVLFPKLGIAEQMKTKSQVVQGVGDVVAKGQAEIGFQQISELVPVKGIEMAGPLPLGVQTLTVFSAGIPVNAPHPKEAGDLIEWLASPVTYSADRKSGLEPVSAK